MTDGVTAQKKRPGPKTEEKFLSRCPKCGDQTLQVASAVSATCALCLIHRCEVITLVPCQREFREIVREPGSIEETGKLVRQRSTKNRDLP